MHVCGVTLLRTRMLMLAALALLIAPRLCAQVFKVQGGDSTLFQAQGGSLEFKAPNYSGSVGAGMFAGRFQFGANFRTHFDGYTFTGGDDSIRFDLPTDIFDCDYYFSARGVGISHGDKDEGYYAFGGVTSTWLGTGFFQSATAEDPVAILFYHRRLTDTLRLYSRGIFSRHTTSLEALEWHPEKWLKASVTAGVGSSKGYFASSLDAETKKLTVRASYVIASSDFHRVMIPTILDTESDKENLEVTYEPNSSLSLSAGHRNLLQPFTPNSPMVQAAMNDFAGSFRIGGTYFGAGFFTSSVEGRDTHGANLYVGHRIKERFEVTANYFDSRTSDGLSNAMFSGTFRETLTPRFSLLQLVTRSAGQTSFAYGGQFITNRFNVRADYENVYLPLRPDRPFEQALALNASVRVLGPVQLNVSSNVAPDGHIRYTFGGTTYLYRYKGLAPWQSRDQESYSFPKYVVQGVVRDEQGNPVAGAAIRLNSEVLYTDDSGRFLYRSRKRASMRLQLAFGEFLTPGEFEMVQAPTAVTPESEDKASDIQIVVRQRRITSIDLHQVTPGAQYVAPTPDAGAPSVK
jgi:hypothetical protein